MRYCNLQDRNVDKKQPKETNNNSLWSSGTCVIVGDSMVNGIDEKRLSKKHGNVKVFHFSGARIEDISQYITPIIKKQPDYLILHVGTNNATTNTSKKIVDDFKQDSLIFTNLQLQVLNSIFLS